MGQLPLAAGEKWYLRHLLQHVPAYSHDELKTFDGQEYDSFQEAAVARGLVVENKTEAMAVYTEVMHFQTPPELRATYVQLTIQGFATLDIFNDEELRKHMTADYEKASRGALHIARNKLLIYLSQQFAMEGKDLEDFGFPPPEHTNTELERARLKYNAESRGEVREKTGGHEVCVWSAPVVCRNRGSEAECGCGGLLMERVWQGPSG